MNHTLALALAGAAPGHFWQIWPHLATAEVLDGFLHLADLKTAAVHANYLQLKVMKLIFTCHHLSDFTV